MMVKIREDREGLQLTRNLKIKAEFYKMRHR